jgi:hypothetical protein
MTPSEKIYDNRRTFLVQSSYGGALMWLIELALVIAFCRIMTRLEALEAKRK